MAIELLQNAIGVLSAANAVVQFTFAKKSTTAFDVDQAGVGDIPIGIFQQAAAQNAAANFTRGGISKLLLGGTVAAGDALAPDAQGRGITGAGDVPVGAIALEAGTVGAIVSVLVTPGFFAAALANAMNGTAAGFRLARGVATTASASDTIVTGLTTVVAAVAVLEDAPSLATNYVQAVVGDQAGTPAAGSILLKSWKPTASGDVTPVAATAFAKKVSWVAVGT